MAHIDISDLARVRAGLVYHATQALATHQHGVATEPSLQALRGDDPCVCLCERTNTYINQSTVKLSLFIEYTLSF